MTQYDPSYNIIVLGTLAIQMRGGPQTIVLCYCMHAFAMQIGAGLNQYSCVIAWLCHADEGRGFNQYSHMLLCACAMQIRGGPQLISYSCRAI